MGGDVWVSMEVKAFLQAARPEWKRSQVNLVKSKLERVGIANIAELLGVLDGSKGVGLNELLRAHDEKVFTEETICALQDQSAKPLPRPQMPSLEDQELSPAPQATSLEVLPVLPVTAAFKDSTAAVEKPQRFAPPTKGSEALLSHQPQQDIHQPNVSNSTDKASSASAKDVDIDPELQRRINKIRAVASVHGLTTEAADGLARKEWEFEQKRKQQFLQTYKPKAKSASVPRLIPISVPTPAPTLAPQQPSGDSVWFCVKFSKVFVKKAPHEKAKSWGFVFGGQKIQVLPQSVRDDHSRLWVELTLFEIWRSCLQAEFHRSFESLGPDERRAFCLIDGSDMKLGTLLEGPLPSEECPVISIQEAYEFRQWLGEMPKAASSVSDTITESTRTSIQTESVQHSRSASSSSSRSPMPPPAAKPVILFEVNDELQVYSRPSLDSRVLGNKAAGERVYAHEEVINGWVQLAGEPGWVLLDASMDDEEESQRARQRALEKGVSSVVRQWAKYKSSAVQGQDLTIDARISLRELLNKCQDDPEVPLEDLEVSLRRAVAYGVEPELLEIAKQKVGYLLKEGPRGRWERKLKDLLEKAKTEKDFRSVIRQCEEIDFPEVAEEAQILLQRFLEDQASAQTAHSAVLDYLIAAIATGDPAAIKTARDTAKAAGVPKKELARAFALAHDPASR
mmetsp:Transcript_57087/g.107578  ORF Transcript_57087/g.107578 Transcript_57087/m.107578 type:complete len:681 (+) Transcript_57087:53-2095(+)